MAKVLISHFSGVFDNQWETTCFYDGLIQSLIRNGNQVLHMITNDFIVEPWAGESSKYLSGISPEKLHNQIKDFDPDFVITFNNSAIPNIEKIVDCPILVWDADTSFYFCEKEKLKKNKDRYHFLSFSRSGREELQNLFGLKSDKLFLVPPATDIRALEVEKNRNVVFIGTHFKADDSLKKQLLKDSNFRKLCLKEFQRSENNFQHLLNNLSDVPESLLKSLSMIQSGNMRVKTLDAIADLGLELFGTPSWVNLIDYSYLLALSYNDQKVYSQSHNETIYNESKISFSISHNQSKTGFPWRVYDIMASNSCLLADYKQDLVDETKDEVPDLPLFRSASEARELCKRLIDDERLRKEIISKSNAYINKECRFENRFKLLEQITNVTLNSNNSIGNYTRIIPPTKLKSSLFHAAALLASKVLTIQQMKVLNKIVLKRIGINAHSSLAKSIQKSKGDKF